MKLCKIFLAVAASCGVFSAPAFALTADRYTNIGEFTGDTMNIRISGTATFDRGLLVAALRFCSPGSLHRYSVSNYFVLFCTPDTAFLEPRPGASRIAVYKRSDEVEGGAWGGFQVNSATAVSFLDLAKLAATCSGTSSIEDLDGALGPLPTYVEVACSTETSTTQLTTDAISYIGLTDVEPQFFGGASTYNNLMSEPLATVIFGVPVTRNIYEALQAHQGLTVGALDEANMPILTQGQITSLYTQIGQSWSTLTGIAPLADDAVYVARRGASSGTQKSFEAVIARTGNSRATGKSCQVQVDPFVDGAYARDNSAASSLCGGSSPVLSVAGSGSSQVLHCMETHQDQGRGAIGVLSAEYTLAYYGGIRFVKVNGIAPTRAQVAAGKYTQYADASLNTRIGSTLPTARAVGYAEFLTTLKSSFADPTTIANSSMGYQTFGLSGLMALDALKGPRPTADYTGAQNRNPWQRLAGDGVSLNNCQPGQAAAF